MEARVTRRDAAPDAGARVGLAGVILYGPEGGDDAHLTAAQFARDLGPDLALEEIVRIVVGVDREVDVGAEKDGRLRLHERDASEPLVVGRDARVRRDPSESG